MIYGYARVSTYGQAKEGNSLESQENRLRAYNCDTILKETYTGTKTDRPKLKELLQTLSEGDTLVVTKLDRFARTLIEGERLIQDLISRDVKIIIDNMGMMLDNTPGSKMMRQIFFAFAEYERNMIVERTQEGKAIAKLDPSFKEGRPRKYGRDQINHALGLLENNSYTKVEKLTGISKSTLIRAKNRKTKERAR